MKSFIDFRMFSKTPLYAFFFLLTISAGAQQEQSSQLREQFKRYQENALQEKIYVHTSKDNYLVGETLFLKIYSVDGMLHQPLNLSIVAYVELLNSSNQSVAQIKVPLKNGVGNGSIVVSNSLGTGNYRIVTYTSWMKNFNADYFFSKDVSIINPLKKAIATKKVNDAKPVARFFPEGGNLVNGLNSKVAFQVTNSIGQGLVFTGAIIDEHNDTLVRFKPLKFGIGNFSFTPQKGKSYRAFIKTSEGNVFSELPIANDNGFVMAVQADESDVKINVESKEQASGAQIFMVVHNRQRVRKLLTTVLNSSGNAQFTIPTQEMEDGISHVTLFDNKLNPIAERLYFKQPERLLSIKIDQLKPSYKKRELVDLSITTEGLDSKTKSANLSMTVYKVDGIQGYDSTNIVSHLLLTSDLKGSVENPYYYAQGGRGDEKKQAIDNLMLTHGWSRFNWTDILKNNWPVVQFSPESEAMNIRASITNERESPLANANMFLSTPAKEIQFYPARSNGRGLLQFYTRDLYGKNEIMFQQVGDTSKFNISVLSPFTENYPTRPFLPFTITKEHEELVRSYTIHSQVQKMYTTYESVPMTIDSVPFYGIPDKSYLLSDYVTFPQLRDVLKEYVFEVMVRKQGDKFKIFVLDKGTNTFFENEPFVMLDGVPVFDTDRIVTQPASNIKRMDVVNRKFFHGLFMFNGIISLTSHDNSTFSGVEMNPEAVVFDYEGLQRSKEFYVPMYDTNQAREDRAPDFRNVLFWSPDINTDDTTGKSNIKFSTSDLPGKYIGVINGLTRDGLPGSTTFTLTVK